MKSVVDVDVDTSKFERFQQLYDRYAAVAAKQPKVWADVGKEQAKITSNFERGVKALHEQAEAVLEELKAREAEERALGKTERHWLSIASSTRSASAASKSLESNVASASASTLKWSGMLTGVAGVLGTVASVMTAGFEAAMGVYNKSAQVANGMAYERRTSMGLGMSVGDHRAFGLDFSRITDTDSFLGNVEEMMTDPGKTGPLWRAGINPRGSVTQVATSYMDWMRNKAVTTPVQYLGLLNQQLGSQVGIDTWMRLHNMSADEYNGDVRNKFETDRGPKGGLDIDDRAARKLQNFATQTQRADLQTDNIFDKKVARLSDSLTAVSQRWVELSQKIANSSVFEKALAKVNDGFGWLASTGIPDLEKSFDILDKTVGETAKKFEEFGKKYDEKYNPQSTGERGRKWFDQSVLGEDDWTDSASAPGLPPPFLRKRGAAAPSSWDAPEAAPGLDLSNILGPDPTSWNPPSPSRNSYSTSTNNVNNTSNRSSVNSTTNNYGGRGAGASVNINIVAPPGFSATSTLAGLNAGLV